MSEDDFEMIIFSGNFVYSSYPWLPALGNNTLVIHH